MLFLFLFCMIVALLFISLYLLIGTAKGLLIDILMDYSLGSKGSRTSSYVIWLNEGVGMSH